MIVGSTMMDLVAYADRLPEAGETVVGSSFQTGFGGKGANQAVMARLLGADVSMVCCVGTDGYGTETLQNFAERGIDTTWARRVPGASGVAPIWVEASGQNRIIILPGANLAMDPNVAVAAVNDGPAPGVVAGQFEIPQSVTAAAFAAARRRGAITVLNPAPAAPLEAELASASDWLIPNEVELTALTGEDPGDGLPSDDLLRSVADRVGCRLLVTLGEAGSALVGTDGSVHRAPAPTVDAIDTTGAGDAFVGGFIWALAGGRSEMDAVRIATTVAADSVTRPGTQLSFATTAEYERLLADL
ncbi:MAG: ribokinase [Acidimicrobiia bacterium]|nr:ribokinase [Acidimicrobiia bacterium]MYC46432.1 ribokinase [Acidimicrobiia bacterium]MYI18876.1 ribokinase [Acidimicrobiia bacterium]